MTLEAGGHTKYELKYHFVWCPKYRKLALRDNRGKYFVMSSGKGTTDEMIRKYIKDHRSHTANDQPNLFG